MKVELSSFGAFEIDQVPTLSLLYQAGYLTIASYEHLYGADAFTLGYPNEEIKRSIAILMVRVLTFQEQPAVESALFRLKMALYRNDMAAFIGSLEKLLAQIPYHLHIQQEAYSIH